MITKSGRRGSNPRRPAWEIGCQLNTKTHHVHGVHSEPPRTPENRYRCSTRVLTRQKCGRTFRKSFRSDSHRLKLAFIAERISKPLKFDFNAISRRRNFVRRTRTRGREREDDLSPHLEEIEVSPEEVELSDFLDGLGPQGISDVSLYRILPSGKQRFITSGPPSQFSEQYVQAQFGMVTISQGRNSMGVGTSRNLFQLRRHRAQ